MNSTNKQSVDDELDKILAMASKYPVNKNKAKARLKLLLIKERIDEAELSESEIQKRADKVPPNLLLNEVVNYTGERIADLENQLGEKS